MKELKGINRQTLYKLLDHCIASARGGVQSIEDSEKMFICAYRQYVSNLIKQQSIPKGKEAKADGRENKETG